MTKAAEAPKRDFKGIWIPKEVWLNKNLTDQEKLFLVEIDSLDNEDGCWATNQYFSKFFNLSIRRCSQIINNLRDKSFINVQLIKDENTNEVKKRIITVNRNVVYGIEESFHTPIERSVYTPIEESVYTLGKEVSIPIERKFQENNTLNNTMNNTTKNKNSKLQSEKMTGKEVVVNKEFKDLLLEEWNSISAIPDIKALRHSTKRYDSLKARLEEFSEGELIQAIRNIKNSDFLQGKQKGVDNYFRLVRKT